MDWGTVAWDSTFVLSVVPAWRWSRRAAVPEETRALSVVLLTIVAAAFVVWLAVFVTFETARPLTTPVAVGAAGAVLLTLTALSRRPPRVGRNAGRAPRAVPMGFLLVAGQAYIAGLLLLAVCVAALLSTRAAGRGRSPSGSWRWPSSAC